MEGAKITPYYNSELKNTLANFPKLAFLFECTEITGSTFLKDSILGITVGHATNTAINNGDGTLSFSAVADWTVLGGVPIPSPGTKNIVAFAIGKPTASTDTKLIVGAITGTGGFRVPLPDGGAFLLSGAVDDTGTVVATGTVATADGNGSVVCGGMTTVQWGSATGLNAGVYNGTTHEQLTVGNIAAKTQIATIVQSMTLKADLRPFMFGAFYTENALPPQLWFKAALMWMQARASESTPRKLLYPGFARL